MRNILVLFLLIAINLASVDIIFANDHGLPHSSGNSHGTSQPSSNDNDTSQSSSNEQRNPSQTPDMDHTNPQSEEHQSESEEPANGHPATSADHDSSDETTDHESGNNHEQVIEERPPNMKVLGTFGAINLIFILIGIWNKWLRKKKEVIEQ